MFDINPWCCTLFPIASNVALLGSILALCNLVCFANQSNNDDNAERIHCSNKKSHNILRLNWDIIFSVCFRFNTYLLFLSVEKITFNEKWSEPCQNGTVRKLYSKLRRHVRENTKICIHKYSKGPTKRPKCGRPKNRLHILIWKAWNSLCLH